MTIDIIQLLFGIVLGFVPLIVFLFWNSYFKVEEGHAAVLTSFGAAQYADKEKNKLKIFLPGIHTKKPWEKIKYFSAMERILDLSGNDGGRHAMAADGTVLRLDSKIRFYPMPEHYYSYLFELKNPMGHIKEMFTCLLRNEIANFSTETPNKLDFVGSYSEIRRDRSRLNHEMESFCETKIGLKYGVKFNGVDLIDILPPQELEVALNAIQNAKSEAETMYARAEADALQKIAAAEQGVEIAKISADASAIEIKTQASAIRKLIDHGNFNHYMRHTETAILGDSRMTFIQKESENV
jgi:regulator of protease activity HflC (stomatin/prohibitin superfamily)